MSIFGMPYATAYAASAKYRLCDDHQNELAPSALRHAAWFYSYPTWAGLSPTASAAALQLLETVEPLPVPNF
jgi:hypothetical protein